MSEPTHFPEAKNGSLPKEIQAQTNGTLYCETEQTPFANPIFFSKFALVLLFRKKQRKNNIYNTLQYNQIYALLTK